MKGRGCTESFPSIYMYIPIVMNRFIFWSLDTYLLYNAIITRNKKQKLILFSFQVRKSAVRHLVFLFLFVCFFVLSTAAAILTQTNLMKFPFCECIENWIEIVFLFVYVTLYHNCIRRRRVKVFYWRHWCVISHCVTSKSNCGLYLVSWDVLYFCRANK